MSEHHIDLNEARDLFDSLMDEAARGTDVVIEQNGRPIVRMRSALPEAPAHVTKDPERGVDLAPAGP